MDLKKTYTLIVFFSSLFKTIVFPPTFAYRPDSPQSDDRWPHCPDTTLHYPPSLAAQSPPLSCNRCENGGFSNSYHSGWADNFFWGNDIGGHIHIFIFILIYYFPFLSSFICLFFFPVCKTPLSSFFVGSFPPSSDRNIWTKFIEHKIIIIEFHQKSTAHLSLFIWVVKSTSSRPICHVNWTNYILNQAPQCL